MALEKISYRVFQLHSFGHLSVKLVNSWFYVGAYLFIVIACGIQRTLSIAAMVRKI